LPITSANGWPARLIVLPWNLREGWSALSTSMKLPNARGTLGYWLDRAAWGRGYAFEAAHAVTRFAFEDVGLSKLEAGHAHDNPPSGRILTKLGFSPLDTVQRFSRPRGENIMQRRYVLTSLRA
jgi:RimJ/RimL family protein N-acetyltransferase